MARTLLRTGLGATLAGSAALYAFDPVGRTNLAVVLGLLYLTLVGITLVGMNGAALAVLVLGLTKLSLGAEPEQRSHGG
ncbi:hypothetical protein D7231_33610 [Streptomyces klenkii]|uniref:Uncharacterized protein n=1 Tax=Streptomyces klenkii TaxID=1420899 RepID=A0A3B0AL68_9ACTN|nr:hypothetical protein [Streptomyces klenkii]RKN60017.1 hypothetical protein D7231_33610 [Streptomyces klenkii]